ncbi:MAG TPA: serine/threonine-protein kinase [Planctomycetaceae bacterium]|jgi:WD40 repeat protein/serine/threonine protein kinase|nr:serine/threonine-protein kinase [Planctomycetaceae bacterium]
MTPHVPRLEQAFESISTPDRHSRMAKIVCPNCSNVVEDPSGSTSQCPHCGVTFPFGDDSTHSRMRAAPTVIAPPPDEIPRQIGRYLILRELGKGGFGIVYLARDPQLDQLVAIKIPRADTGMHPTALRRFEREGRNAARLKRDGIVRVLTVEYEGAVPFIVSEYVEGVTLTERLTDRLKDGPPFEFRESAELVKTLAASLEYAHSQDVIHRDVKPSNILIATDGKPWLMDFGLAMRESLDESIAMPTHIIGTPGYMSPEQASGKQKVDRRCDIYSLGVVLYQLITGEVPFRGEMRMVLRQVIEEDPRNPRSLNADIPLDLETICETAMLKEVDQRYQTADKLAQELGRYLRGEPIEARPITRLDRAWRWCKRNPLTSSLVASIAGVLMLSAMGATLMAASEHQARTEEHRARTQVEQLLEEKSELLSKSYVDRANRFLGPPAEQQEFSPMKALPWMYAAMDNDQHNAKRWEASRIRLGAALRQLPSVERVWSHKGGIFVAAISPAGDRFVTGGDDGTMYVWDLSREDPVTPPMVHPGRVTGVAFTTDGKSIATGCADGAVRIWDAATGELIHGPVWDSQLGKAPGAGYHSVLIGVDHQSLLTVRAWSAHDSVAQVWNATTAVPIGKTVNVGSGFVCLADSGNLIFGLKPDALVAWDPQTGKEKHRLEDKGKFTNLAAIGPDGVTVAVADTKQCVQFWNCRANKKVAVTSAHSSPVTALKFSSDGSLLSSGTNNGTVYVWKSSDGSLVGQQQLSAARIGSLDFSSDAHQLAAVAGMHGMVSIVGLDDKELVPEPIHIPSTIREARWIPGKDLLLSASADGAVRLWRAKPQQAAVQLAHAVPIRGAAASKDRQTLATIDSEGACSITDLQGGDGKSNKAAWPSIPTGMFEPVAVVLTSDGSKVALAGRSGAVALWDVAGRNKIRDLDPGAAQMRKVLPSDVRLAFTGDDRLLIYVMNRWMERFCEISVWDVKSRERLRYQRLESDGSLGDFDLQVEGSVCALAIGKHVMAWDAATGQQVGQIMLHDNFVTSCRLSHDGTRLISGCNDGIARIWDVSTGKIVAATIKHPQPVVSVAYCSDGLRFATGCFDGTARIWSMSGATALTPPLAHGAAVTRCTFSPNSRWLLTTSGDASSSISCESIVRVWDATTDEPLFGLPLNFFERRPAGPFEGDPRRPSQIEFSSFSPDSRQLNVMIHAGLLEALSVEPDSRAAPELLREVVIRAGVQPDGTGGLSIVDSDRLTRVFRRGN